MVCTEGKMIQIQKFINKIRSFDARGVRDFTMPLSDAKDLHTEITSLLLQMEDMRSKLIEQVESQEITDTIMSGGSFKESNSG
jgi:hypothetical protein